MAAAASRADRSRTAVALGRACAAAGRPLIAPALCLHGLGVSPRHLRPLVEELQKERPVAAPTLPLAVSVAAWAELLAPRLEGPTLLFANSMGCQAAVELAIRIPERVAGIVLVGPTPDPAAPKRRQQFARLVADSTHEPVGLNWIVATDYVRRGPRRTLISAREMLRHPMLERASLVAVPALVIRGERDPIVPLAWARQVATAMGAPLVEIAGAAHCAHFTHPAAVVDAARALGV